MHTTFPIKCTFLHTPVQSDPHFADTRSHRFSLSPHPLYQHRPFLTHVHSLPTIHLVSLPYIQNYARLACHNTSPFTISISTSHTHSPLACSFLSSLLLDRHQVSMAMLASQNSKAPPPRTSVLLRLPLTPVVLINSAPPPIPLCS